MIEHNNKKQQEIPAMDAEQDTSTHIKHITWNSDTQHNYSTQQLRKAADIPTMCEFIFKIMNEGLIRQMQK